MKLSLYWIKQIGGKSDGDREMLTERLIAGEKWWQGEMKGVRAAPCELDCVPLQPQVGGWPVFQLLHGFAIPQTCTTAEILIGIRLLGNAQITWDHFLMQMHVHCCLCASCCPLSCWTSMSVTDLFIVPITGTTGNDLSSILYSSPEKRGFSP